MPNYFSKFPKIDYKFADGSTQNLTDINIKFALSQITKTSKVFYPYEWSDNDRVDILADKYYDSDDYYWLVMLSTDSFDINHDFAIPDNIFIKYLIKKYEKFVDIKSEERILEYCSTTIHHYEDSDGDWTTEVTINPVSIYDYEFSENENKRNKYLIAKSQARLIKSELEEKLKKIKAENIDNEV